MVPTVVRTPILPRALQVISSKKLPFQIADIDRVRSKSSHGQFLVIVNKKVRFQLAGIDRVRKSAKCGQGKNSKKWYNWFGITVGFWNLQQISLHTDSRFAYPIVSANWNGTFMLKITKNCPWEDFGRTLSISAIWNAYFLLEITCNARGKIGGRTTVGTIFCHFCPART